jgi:hypothetical protein
MSAKHCLTDACVTVVKAVTLFTKVSDIVLIARRLDVPLCLTDLTCHGPCLLSLVSGWWACHCQCSSEVRFTNPSRACILLLCRQCVSSGSGPCGRQPTALTCLVRFQPDPDCPPVAAWIRSHKIQTGIWAGSFQEGASRQQSCSCSWAFCGKVQGCCRCHR